MIKIFQLTPEPVQRGSFSDGVLEINDKRIEMTKDQVIDRFSRGYWRCSLIEDDPIKGEL